MYTEKNLKKWTEGIKNTHTHTPDGEGIIWTVKDKTLSMAMVYKRSLNNGHKCYTKWQDIKDLEAQKTTGPKSVETVWNYIATSVHL